jgi:hypothetical protein
MGMRQTTFFGFERSPTLRALKMSVQRKKTVSFKVADVVSFVASALPDRLAFSPRRPAGSEYATALPK